MKIDPEVSKEWTTSEGDWRPAMVRELNSKGGRLSPRTYIGTGSKSEKIISGRVLPRDVNYWLRPENRLIDREAIGHAKKASLHFRRWVRKLFTADDNDWKFDPVLVTFYLAGKVVPHAEALAVVEAFHVHHFIPKVDALADMLAAGEITISAWQAEMATLIKQQHIVSAIAGKGSRELMTFTDWGRTGGRLGFQYGKLDRFAYQIATGNFSPAYIKARARMYARGQRIAYWDTLTQAHIDSGEFTEECRHLGIAEHCDDCVYYEELGWQPLGWLPNPGEQSRCLSNCQCTKEYR